MHGINKLSGRTSIFRLTICMFCILLLSKGVTMMKMPSLTPKGTLENRTAMFVKAESVSLQRNLDRKSALTAQLRKSRTKRNVMQMARMLKCTSGCNPLSYRGYGCYCGYMGAGQPVDGIDRCCLQHDWCYTFISCPQTLIYFIPYTWHCLQPGEARCGVTTMPGVTEECATELCECDREFAECVSNFPCPRAKPECKPKKYMVLQTLVKNDI